jgi:hypothetical protein
MIQPVIGSTILGNNGVQAFGPPISGHGFSSTGDHAAGYIKFVNGLGCAIDGAPAHLVDGSQEAQQFAITVSKFLAWTDSGPHSVLHVPSTMHGVAETGGNPTSQLPLFDPVGIIEKLQAIERITKYPVYVEWALGGSDPRPFILQIAPAEMAEHDTIDVNREGSMLMEARNLVGHGVKEASKIVLIRDDTDVENLLFFNPDRDNEGYIVIFRSSQSISTNGNSIKYSDVSRAGVVIEIEECNILGKRHQHGDIAQHLLGASRQTDKFVGDIPGRTDMPDIWDKVHKEGKEVELGGGRTLIVLDGHFRVVADKTRNSIKITDLESGE